MTQSAELRRRLQRLGRHRPVERLAAPPAVSTPRAEPTGLPGGAGPLFFLVGVGRFTASGFRLRQYFLRDPAEEPGMLHALQEDLEESSGFVTFNGRGFGLPLLAMRYGIGLRRRWHLSGLPHFDPLFPARRLWRRAPPDCSLGTLEAHLLGVERTEEDGPGARIPALYRDDLRSAATQ